MRSLPLRLKAEERRSAALARVADSKPARGFTERCACSTAQREWAGSLERSKFHHPRIPTRRLLTRALERVPGQHAWLLARTCLPASAIPVSPRGFGCRQRCGGGREPVLRNSFDGPSIDSLPEPQVLSACLRPRLKHRNSRRVVCGFGERPARLDEPAHPIHSIQ